MRSSEDTTRPVTASTAVTSPDTAVSKPASEALVGALARPNAFLFVNPTSGGNAAGCFTAEKVDESVITGVHRGAVRLHVADIRDGSSGNKPMFLKLKRLVEEMQEAHVDEKVTVVMAGGDGTVLWGISEIWEHGIDDSYIVFGVIPFGTGNDFAKALNWQPAVINDPFSTNLPQLTSLLSTWADAKVIYHDIWDIEITLRDAQGCFKKIDSASRQKIILKNADGLNTTYMKKKLNNYFSIGVESRIGIGFDRHRKQSALQNKIVYMNEGVKKALFHKPVNMAKYVRNMKVVGDGKQQTVFSADPLNMTQRTLRRCASLIAINIPSFASGLDIWKNAHRIALRDPDGTKLAKEGDLAELAEAQQQMGDGKLEWVSFSNVTSLGTEQILEGLGRRVHQGHGPFVLNFQENLTEDDRVYFQIDGEFYIMTKPAQLQIRHYRKIACLLNGAVKSGGVVEASRAAVDYSSSSDSQN